MRPWSTRATATAGSATATRTAVRRWERPPGRHAGNLDNREPVVGSTLYITSLRGRLRLTVRKDMKLAWPRAETPTDYISMATDPDLTIATRGAIQEMIDFLVAEKHLTRHQAYQLVSVAGNVAVTQLVDKPNHGVHVRLPKSVFKR